MRDRNFGDPTLKLFFDFIRTLKKIHSRDPFFCEVKELTTLTQQEYACLLFRYENEETLRMTCKSVANILTLSNARIPQICSKALRKMRRQSTHNGLVNFLKDYGL